MKTSQWILLAFSMILSGCSQDLYKQKLIPNSRSKAITNPYGAYMELKTVDNLYSGEFIAHSDDTLYLLTESKLIRTPSNEIERFEIVLTQNSSKKYLRMTGISVIPSLLGSAIHSSEYGGSFLLFGTLTAIPGLIASAVESRKKPHVIAYPDQSLEYFQQYARFPYKIPEGLEINDLSGSLPLTKN